MDLGITGRNALVCGSSKGLGKGCAFALAREGVNLVITARGSEALEATAAEIRNATGVSVRIVACDITTPEGRDAALQVLPDPDILVTNAGGPPPGDYRDWRRESWISALDANMIAPIKLIRLTIESMIDRKFGRVVNITSSAVKAPIAFLGLSNGARTGLTGFAAGLARQVIKHNVTINNLLPGYHATDRLGAAADAVAKQTGKNIEEAQQAILDQIPAGRFGSPEEFGAACAFLWSAASGFIAGTEFCCWMERPTPEPSDKNGGRWRVRVSTANSSPDIGKDATIARLLPPAPRALQPHRGGRAGRVPIGNQLRCGLL